MTRTILNYTQIYTTDQAAEVLQINIQTLRKYIREGKLSASKIGAKDYRITGEDIKDFLDYTKINKGDNEMKNGAEQYRGIVKDDLGTMETKKTKWYSTYKEAHDAAENLCKKTMGDRGSIDVEEK